MTPEQAKREKAKRRIREDFGAYFRATRGKRYFYGRHTNAIVAACQKATDSVERGECFYGIVCVPPRHGKSDGCSRTYPSWHLGRNPFHEIILTSYNYSLATDMAYEARALFRTWSPLFRTGLLKDKSEIGSWRTEAGGAMHSAGFNGTISGRGAHVLIVDDYFKNRVEAESETVRSSVWHSFQSDLMTRLAPVHAVLIVANRWHPDDLVARIQAKNEPTNPLYDPDFPKFEVISFPAQAEGWVSTENEEGWLFPQRFSGGFYRAMKAFVGTYAWNSQYLQNPSPRIGNMLRADMCEILDDFPEDLVFCRGWDLASTEKELVKDDPDFTVGIKAAVFDNNIYIADMRRGQWGTTTRDSQMLSAAEEDGPGVTVRIESVGGYVDTYKRIKANLMGKAIVRKVSPQTDKVARASILEPYFEAGRVFLKPGPWNEEFIRECSNFPSGAHDDIVDGLVIATYQEIMGRGKMGLTRG